MDNLILVKPQKLFKMRSWIINRSIFLLVLVLKTAVV